MQREKFIGQIPAKVPIKTDFAHVENSAEEKEQLAKTKSRKGVENTSKKDALNTLEKDIWRELSGTLSSASATP